jgi:membrane protease YdiL (CAAX protease family)
MTPLDIFLNREDRLRSGWRFAVFVAAYYSLLVAFVLLLRVVLQLASPQSVGDFNRLPGAALYLIQFFIQFTPALLLGWACGKLLDGVPPRALGWSLRRGWLRDLALGSAIGFAALVSAALVASAFGGFHFRVAPEGFGAAFVKTFFGALVVYVLLAAAEEAMFRGYPLQTLMRSLPFVVALLPSSIIFAYVHTDNPNVPCSVHNFVSLLTGRATDAPCDYVRFIFLVVNTALAGVWLCVAYLRTRSLWLPLGLHWSWNWAMGSVLGLPVSGITSLTRAPLLRAADAGPAWLTGGAYGIEGGAAGTIALALATAFVWRAKFLRADEELKRFTDDEMPKSREP